MRRTPILLLLLAVLLLAGGCGKEEKKDTSLGPIGDDAETSAAPTPGGGETSTAEEQAPFDAKGNEAIRGKVDASTPEEEAVVDAWFAYWDARTRSYFDAKVDPDLGKVAAADAVSDVVQYVAYLKSKKLHTVGDTRFGVSDLDIKDNSATLTSCAENKSLDRYADGTPGEDPMPFFVAKGTLVKAGGAWRVVATPVEKSADCRG